MTDSAPAPPLGVFPGTPLLFQCPECERCFQVPPGPAGRRVRCLCGAPLSLPDNPESIPVLEPMPARSPAAPQTGIAAPQAAEDPGHPPPRGPLDRLRAVLIAGTAESWESFHLRLEAERWALARGFDSLICLDHLRGVDPHAYQVRTVRHVLRTLRGRALLADEVGLGKTVEAGMILKELWLRGLVRRVLILTPASLVTQWQEEMAAKFGLSFVSNSDPDGWGRQRLVIASLDTAKSERNFEALRAVPQDLVIVDEAHALKNGRTLNWKLVNALQKRYLLLLSATPVQNDLLELFHLVTLLRPGQLYTLTQFKKAFLERGDRRSARDPQKLRALLREVMVRNRRGEVDVQLPPREARTLSIALTPREEELYLDALDWIRGPEFRGLYGDQAPLVALALLKQLGSSTDSFRSALAGTLLPRARAKSPSAVPSLEDLLEKAQAVDRSAKTEALRRLLHDAPPTASEKLLVFTQYRTTLEAVARDLVRDGHTVARFHGEMSLQEKDDQVAAFRSGAGVLVSTDAGGQGRNLQFCHREVNYDLPWNPMRLEQRIGRVHRIGQTRPVSLVNLAARGTLEARILSLLEQKLQLFRLVVGELDMIIGRVDVEQEVLSRFLASRDDREFQGRLDEFGRTLEDLKTGYDATCAYDRRLFGSQIGALAPPAGPEPGPARTGETASAVGGSSAP